MLRWMLVIWLVCVVVGGFVSGGVVVCVCWVCLSWMRLGSVLVLSTSLGVCVMSAIVDDCGGGGVDGGGVIRTCCSRCGCCEGESYMVLDWLLADGLGVGKGLVPWMCVCEECVEPGDLVVDE